MPPVCDGHGTRRRPAVDLPAKRAFRHRRKPCRNRRCSKRATSCSPTSEHLHAFTAKLPARCIARKPWAGYAKDRPENHAFRAVVNQAQDAHPVAADAGLLRQVGRGCRAGIAGRGLTGHAIAAVRRDNAFPLDRHRHHVPQPYLHGFARRTGTPLCARRAWPNPPCSTTSTCPARSGYWKSAVGRRAD